MGGLLSRIRESSVEHKVTQFAKKQGWLSYKFSSPSQRSVPDRIYINHGETVYVEFKRPGKTSTKAQQHEQKKIRDKGAQVFEIDSVEAGIELFTDL